MYETRYTRPMYRLRDRAIKLAIHSISEQYLREMITRMGEHRWPILATAFVRRQTRLREMDRWFSIREPRWPAYIFTSQITSSEKKERRKKGEREIYARTELPRFYIQLAYTWRNNASRRYRWFYFFFFFIVENKEMERLSSIIFRSNGISFFFSFFFF